MYRYIYLPGVLISFDMSYCSSRRIAGFVFFWFRNNSESTTPNKLNSHDLYPIPKPYTNKVFVFCFCMALPDTIALLWVGVACNRHTLLLLIMWMGCGTSDIYRVSFLSIILLKAYFCASVYVEVTMRDTKYCE